jgi:hypothetical protein
MLPGLAGAILAGGDGPLVTYIGNNYNLASLLTHTFSAQGIGDASSDRFIAVSTVGFNLSSTCQPSTLTVGGQATTRLVVSSAVSEGGAGIFLTNAPVTTGTTADIVVTFSSTSEEAYIVVYTVTRNTPLLADTLALRGTSLSGSLDVYARGCVIGIAGFDNTGSYSWTGLTEDFEFTDYVVAASQNFSVSEANRTISASISGGSTGSKDFLLAAAFN